MFCSYHVLFVFPLLLTVLFLDDILSEIGGYQVFFTFFGALVINNHLLSAEWSEVVGVLLIMCNLGVVLYLLSSKWDTIVPYIDYLINGDPSKRGNVESQLDTTTNSGKVAPAPNATNKVAPAPNATNKVAPAPNATNKVAPGANAMDGAEISPVMSIPKPPTTPIPTAPNSPRRVGGSPVRNPIEPDGYVPLQSTSIVTTPLGSPRSHSSAKVFNEEEKLGFCRSPSETQIKSTVL
jgi:hypothetical protein